MNSVWPSSTLTLDFQLLELWKNKFVLFLNHWSVIIYFINSNHRKQCLLHRIIIPKRKRIFFPLFSILSSVPKMGLVHTTHSAFTFDDGLPWWLRWWRICSQHGRPGFNPWVGKVYLEEEMAIHFSILAWRIPWTEELQFPWRATVRVRRDWAINTHFTFDEWMRKKYCISSGS